MVREFISRTILFAALCLAQGLVLNHVSLFGCATPLLYVYMALTFPRGYPAWASLLWCFAIGLCADTFTNTPGVAAASMTLTGVMQPYVLEMFMQREDDEDFKPAMSKMGFAKYLYYMLILISIFCIAYYSLGMFTFFNWLKWAECVAGSIVITALMVYVVEHLKR